MLKKLLKTFANKTVDFCCSASYARFCCNNLHTGNEKNLSVCPQVQISLINLKYYTEISSNVDIGTKNRENNHIDKVQIVSTVRNPSSSDSDKNKKDKRQGGLWKWWNIFGKRRGIGKDKILMNKHTNRIQSIVTDLNSETVLSKISNFEHIKQPICETIVHYDHKSGIFLDQSINKKVTETNSDFNISKNEMATIIHLIYQKSLEKEENGDEIDNPVVLMKNYVLMHLSSTNLGQIEGNKNWLLVHIPSMCDSNTFEDELCVSSTLSIDEIWNWESLYCKEYDLIKHISMIFNTYNAV